MNDVEHQPGEASPPADASPEAKMRWTAGVPRWVKVFVITALGLALLMVVAMLLSGGQRAPAGTSRPPGSTPQWCMAPQPQASSAETTRRLSAALMSMPPALRRAMLAAHIICSVGWLGAAAAYLALGVAAQVSMQPQVVRAAWIGMELSGWFVIVPLACLAYLTGLVCRWERPGDCSSTTGSSSPWC